VGIPGTDGVEVAGDDVGAITNAAHEVTHLEHPQHLERPQEMCGQLDTDYGQRWPPEGPDPGANPLRPAPSRSEPLGLIDRPATGHDDKVSIHWPATANKVVAYILGD